MKNTFFKIPFSFDPDRLLRDLSICEMHEWNSHFNKKDYNGSWTSIALRSSSGKENDIYALSGRSFSDTPLLEACSYFQSIIQSFECEKESIRLLSLAPGSSIKEHRDLDAGYESGFFRLHIPIITNTNVSFIVNRNNLIMNQGECWYANFNLPHSAENKGTRDRVHLVIDCMRNEWSDKLFERSGYDFEFEKRSKEYAPETKKKIIAELSRINSATSKKLIEQLKKE